MRYKQKRYRRGLTKRATRGFRKGLTRRVEQRKTGRIVEAALETEEQQRERPSLAPSKTYRLIQGKAYHTYHTPMGVSGYTIYAWTYAKAPSRDHRGIRIIHDRLKGKVEDISDKLEETWRGRTGSYYYGEETSQTEPRKDQEYMKATENIEIEPIQTAVVLFKKGEDKDDKSRPIPEEVETISMN